MSGMLASAVGWAKENPIHAAGVIAACAGIGAVSLNSRPSSDPDTAAEYSADEDFLAGQFFKSQVTGLLIYQQQWLVSDPRGVVLCLHGGGEHSGRYAHIAKYFNSHGYSVCAVDHAGHGRSEGTRMHSTDFMHSVADIQQYLDETVLPMCAGTPVFVLGHSIGGLLGALVAAGAPPGQLQAVALTGPCIRLGASMNDTLAKVVLPLAAALFPKLRVPGPPVQHLTHSRAVQLQYLRDPLNSASCTLAFVQAMLAAQQQAVRSAVDIYMPLLVLHGAEDQVCDMGGSEALVQAAPKAELRKVPQGKHEILNDTGFQQHLADILMWFQQKSPQSSSAQRAVGSEQ